jgi:hypothetical protein
MAAIAEADAEAKANADKMASIAEAQAAEDEAQRTQAIVNSFRLSVIANDVRLMASSFSTACVCSSMIACASASSLALASASALADRLPERNNEIGVIGRQTLGATRTQEKKVVQIDCQESVL